MGKGRLEAFSDGVLAIVITIMDSEFAARIGSDWKGKIPLAAYAAGIGLAFVSVWISMALYAGIAAMWFIPDRRFER